MDNRDIHRTTSEGSDDEQIQDFNDNTMINEDTSINNDLASSRNEDHFNTQLQTIQNELKGSLMQILTINQQTQEKLHNLEQEMDDIKNQTRNNNSLQNSASETNTLTSNRNIARTDRITSPDPDIDFPHLRSKGDNYHTNPVTNFNMKLKPPHFDGQEDLTEFLEAFQISVEINKWNYEAKGLYLASSLHGNARTILQELETTEKRDYRTLVKKLTERYGSLNKVEVFRTQLKNRVRKPGESISELAQNIRKLSIQSYPNAPKTWIETIGLDSFIDALTDSDIRIKLKEAELTTISEAEQTGIRLEAYRTADKQRHQVIPVCVAEQTKPNETVNNKLETLCQTIETLGKQVQNLQSGFNSRRPQYENTQYKGNNSYNNHQDPQLRARDGRHQEPN